MNIKKFLPIALLLTTTSLFAQQKKFQQTDSERFFRFGVKGGVNINKISGQSYKSGFNYNYQLGGFLQFNFSNRFGLQPEVNFVQSSSEFSNDATDIYDDLFRSGSQKQAKLNYLEIPLLLNVNVGQSKHVKLQFGPAYGVRLSQSIDSLVNNIDIYKGGDWSAIGGLWIQLPVVNIGARYKYGFTNINSVDYREKWRAQAIQIFIGITI
jgi:Outer membrane protein beta-barrel domain